MISILVHPTQGPLVVNNGLAMAGVQPPSSLGFGAPNSTANMNSLSGNSGPTSASRRESMDRGSSAFSPSLLEQYKNKGWPNYSSLGAAGKSPIRAIN